MITWDDYFMLLAQAAAFKSKDVRQVVGCVVVGPHRNVLTTGFNGFPRGVQETDERMLDKPTKLLFIAHAERNAMDQAARHGISLHGASMFVTKHPCNECAKSIIQAGIQRVVCPPLSADSSWSESARLAKTMLDEAQVVLHVLQPTYHIQLQSTEDQT